MRYLSLFSGIGGFEVGLLQVFPHAKCVGYSEINKHCIHMYQSRFPSHPLLGDGDIRSIDFRPLKGQVDLVLAGFPCQDLSSLNNNRKGLQGNQSSLFYEALRCLQETRARFFVFENVKSMNPEQRDLISFYLGVQPVMIDSAPFTLLTRKRLFWANFMIPLVTQGNLLRSFVSLLDPVSQIVSQFEFLVRSLKFVRNIFKPVGYNKKGQVIRRIDRYKIYSDTNEMLARCLPEDYSKNAVIDRRFDPPVVRKFSVQECERLQGFPEGWTGHFDEVPTGAKISALGNAVNAKVTHYIFICLKQSLNTFST